MQNVPIFFKKKLPIFVDISDYKENMSIGPPKYCLALGTEVKNMVNQQMI